MARIIWIPVFDLINKSSIFVIVWSSRLNKFSIWLSKRTIGTRDSNDFRTEKIEKEKSQLLFTYSIAFDVKITHHSHNLGCRMRWYRNYHDQNSQHFGLHRMTRSLCTNWYICMDSWQNQSDWTLGSLELYSYAPKKLNQMYLVTSLILCIQTSSKWNLLYSEHPAWMTYYLNKSWLNFQGQFCAGLNQLRPSSKSHVFHT